MAKRTSRKPNRRSRKRTSRSTSRRYSRRNGPPYAQFEDWARAGGIDPENYPSGALRGFMRGEDPVAWAEKHGRVAALRDESEPRRARRNSRRSRKRTSRMYEVSDGVRRAEVFSATPGTWVATMAGKRTREHRTKAAAMKSARAMLAGTTRNGWGRKASRSLKGSRRPRRKRTSRRNTSYDYGSMSHPGSYDSRGRPRRNSRKRVSRKNAVTYPYGRRKMRSSTFGTGVKVKGGLTASFGNRDRTGVIVEMDPHDRHKALVRWVPGYDENWERTGSLNIMPQVIRRPPLLPPKRNGRRRHSRKNQTYYIPIPPPSKNSRRRKRASRRR